MKLSSDIFTIELDFSIHYRFMSRDGDIFLCHFHAFYMTEYIFSAHFGEGFLHGVPCESGLHIVRAIEVLSIVRARWEIDRFQKESVRILEC